MGIDCSKADQKGGGLVKKIEDTDVLRYLCLLIEEKRYTQADIAREIGMSTSYLSQILSGKYGNIWNNISSICHAIGMPLSEFFKGLEDDTRR